MTSEALDNIHLEVIFISSNIINKYILFIIRGFFVKWGLGLLLKWPLT
jgi:hypothetical protein